MFTGIIEIKGTVKNFLVPRLRVAATWSADTLQEGQSVSVNGCCLTVVKIDPVYGILGASSEIEFDISPETLLHTTFGDAKPGDLVNLERPLKLGDSLGGHFVSGHIDSTGKVVRIRANEADDSRVIWFSTAPQFKRWLIQKGSAAVNGVSLTVNELDVAGFSVTLIPHTLRVTTLGLLKEGDFVNLEFDLLAKFVEQRMNQKSPSPTLGKILEFAP